MRLLSLLFFTFILVSCNPKAQTKNDNMQKSDSIYATELIDNDFLKYVDNSKKDSLKTELKKSFDIYDEDNFKIIHMISFTMKQKYWQE